MKECNTCDLYSFLPRSEAPSKGEPPTPPYTEHPTRGTGLECIRIIKTYGNLHADDRWCVEKFTSWLGTLKEWWILIERKGVTGVRYWKRDFYFFPVFNRFQKGYVKRVIRKFEEIKFFAEDHSFVHIVLTVDREMSIYESIKALRINWNKLRALLKKRLKRNYPFITVLEPQKSGYPHLHILLFTPKFVIKKGTLSRWCNEHGLGRIVYMKRYWANGGFRKKPIFYLIKYLGKQYKKEEWTANELVFYACVWYSKTKTYTLSRNFSFKNRNKKHRNWMVTLLTKEELVSIIRHHIKLRFWSFNYPLEYYNWGLKEYLTWKYC